MSHSPHLYGDEVTPSTKATDHLAGGADHMILAEHQAPSLLLNKLLGEQGHPALQSH